MMKRHRIRSAALLLLASMVMMGGEIKYFRESPFAFDFATLVSAKEFNEKYLVQLFKDFAHSEQNKHRIGMLTVGVEDRDLSPTFPSHTFKYFNPGPRYSGDWSQRSRVAQAFYLNGAASATIKDNNSSKEIQILGDRDPRILSVNGKHVRIFSFLIYTSNLFVDRPYYASDSDTITIFAVADPLITSEDATRILRGLQTAIGTERVALEVRPDTLFAMSAGPPFDVFHPPFPDVSEPSYNARSQIDCVPPIIAPRERRDRPVCVIQAPRLPADFERK